MSFEVLPNLFLLTPDRLDDSMSRLSSHHEDDEEDQIVVVFLAASKEDVCLSSNNHHQRKKNQFFFSQNYVATDTASSKQVMSVVGNAFFNCNTILVVHQKTDTETPDIFLADFMKRFAGARSYKADILDTIQLNLKSYKKT